MTDPRNDGALFDELQKEPGHDIEQLEQQVHGKQGSHDWTPNISIEQQKKVMYVICSCIHLCAPDMLTLPSRKIDVRLLPILGLMYSFSLIDRTNLGLALVTGMGKELHLQTDNRYSIIVALFFVMYIIFEIPSVSAAPIVFKTRLISKTTHRT